MSSRHLSLRLDSDTFERLENRSHQSGQSRSELARVLLDEGLRMEAHPGIVFRSGPAGRRPGLATGPDVWEVVRVLKGTDARGEEALGKLADLMGILPQQVSTAIRYYADYRKEIDEWIRRVDDEATRVEAAYHRTLDLLER